MKCESQTTAAAAVPLQPVEPATPAPVPSDGFAATLDTTRNAAGGIPWDSDGPQDSPPKVEDAWPRWNDNPRSAEWDLVLASENRSEAWSSLVSTVEQTLNMDPHYALALDVRSMEPTSNRLRAWERLLSDVCRASAAAARKVWRESPPPGFFDSGDVAQALALLEAAEARHNG
ncbi:MULTISPECIES: hypothetical protein [Pandoraea]|uniref:hypothetical protein n=1 Tax=Pandoraea TaxID=93217 RepID=UPI001F5C4AA0|nr:MULTISPECIES: hypothetical protein [Pandoraea]MCI3206270.1 hypothetical protein [Pandoraea sp. LA3]MDN4584298.1 hypothetical protein [Pandoraea capi]